MDYIQIALEGLGTVNALLLLLLGVDPTNSEYIRAKIDYYMNKYKGKVKNSKDVKTILTWILDDKFKKETIKLNKKMRNTDLYMAELQRLKDEMITFYFKRLEEIKKDDNGIDRTCDVHSTLGAYALQLMRLRMVIEPEINLLTNPYIVNKSTGERTLYLTAKAFWMSDEGKKVRSITKSLGRMSDYPGQREGKAAKEESIRRVQPMLWEKYKSTYP